MNRRYEKGDASTCESMPNHLLVGFHFLEGLESCVQVHVVQSKYRHLGDKEELVFCSGIGIKTEERIV